MTELRIRALAKGLATRVPGLRAFACRHSGGTESARYCYSVWLRHLVMAGNAGVSTRPERVAELGPGDSFGIGLAGMLSGTDHYLAFDAKPHARVERNLAVFAELVELFSRRAPIPGETEFPEVFPGSSATSSERPAAGNPAGRRTPAGPSARHPPGALGGSSGELAD